LGSKSITLNKALREKLRKLAREQSERSEDLANNDIDLNAQELAFKARMESHFSKAFVSDQSVDDSLDAPAIDNDQIEKSWAAFSERLSSHSADETKPGSKKQIFGLHYSSYIAAAAVLLLVFFNSPWSPTRTPMGAIDDEQMVTKGSLSGDGLKDVIACSYDLVQGPLGEENVVAIVGPNTKVPMPGRFNVAIRCMVASSLAKAPIYAHVRYQVGDKAYYLRNISVRLNSMQILNNPSDQNGSFFTMPEDANPVISILLSDKKTNDADIWVQLDEGSLIETDKAIAILDQLSTRLQSSDD